MTFARGWSRREGIKVRKATQEAIGTGADVNKNFFKKARKFSGEGIQFLIKLKSIKYLVKQSKGNNIKKDKTM